MAQDNLIEPFMVEMAAILNNKRPPSERKLEEQRALFLEGYIRFAEIFAQSELGNMEVDIAKLALYIFSPEFKYQTTYDIKNIDDIYMIIEDDILNGMPIWRYFKCSEKTMMMLEKNFADEAERKKRELEEKYICKRCKYLDEKNMDLGYMCRCNSRDRNRLKRGYFHDYTKIKECKYFTSK